MTHRTGRSIRTKSRWTVGFRTSCQRTRINSARSRRPRRARRWICRTPIGRFTTPFATIIGLFSNVSETEAELHQDQIDWFKGELQAADTNKALIVTIHHPPFSGDDEHSGSSVAEQVLFESFAETNRYPHLVLSGHVHKAGGGGCGGGASFVKTGFLLFSFLITRPITGIYTSALFAETRTPEASVVDQFTIDLKARKVTTTA